MGSLINHKILNVNGNWKMEKIAIPISLQQDGVKLKQLRLSN